MRRRTTLIALPLATVLTGAAAFVGYGAWSRSQPVEYSRGGAFAAADDVLGVTPPPASSPVPQRSAGATVSAHSSATPSGRRAPGSAARARPPAAAPPLTATDPPAAAAPATAARVPRPGTYRLAAEGSERASFGPVSVCRSTVPSSSSWVVRRDGDGAYVVDHRWYPGQAGQHDERHVYRYDGDTVTLEYEKATVTCAGQRQSTEVTFAPAQLRVQGPLRVGARWSSRGGDAERTEDAASEVLRAERVVVAGRSLDTWVVETRVRISGDESGTRVQRWWWAPSLALPVKVEEHITAQRSGGEYSSDVTVTVVELPSS